MAARKRPAPKRSAPAPRRQPSLRDAVSARDKITDEDVDAAVSIIQRDYYSEVNGLADDLKRQIKDGEISDRDQLEERLHEEVDGSARVIYTFKSKLGLLVSTNADAYEDEFGEAPKDVAQAMSMAMQADVREYLDDVDFDD